MKRFVYLICILILATSCKEVYEKPPQAFIDASLWNSAVKVNSVTNAKITPSLTIKGIGLETYWVKDSLLSDNVVLIPLSAKDTTSYLISFDSITDTLTIFHETTQKYASMETGLYYEYKLKELKYTHNRIDSLEISDSLVTINWHENIKFYLRPLPAGSN